MCTRERVSYYKSLFRLVLCYKRIGPSCCTLFTFVTCCSLQPILSQNYLLPTISVLAENTLLKTACHFLLLLFVFDTLTCPKDYDRCPILVGHRPTWAGLDEWAQKRGQVATTSCQGPRRGGGKQDNEEREGAEGGPQDRGPGGARPTEPRGPPAITTGTRSRVCQAAAAPTPMGQATPTPAANPGKAT